jgi:hypothetical protein
MKKIKSMLLAGILVCSINAMAQSNSNPTGTVPINADRASTPPPIQTAPVTPQPAAPPTNKVMLRSQLDSMDTKKRTTPPPTQKVYTDSTRYIVHPGDTETVPKRKQ